MLTAVLLGVVLGLRHAFDPDHVIAVSTLVARNRRPWSSLWLGVSWGLGHSATILGVGVCVIGMRLAIPDGVAASFELCVGVMLVALGLANLRAARGSRAEIARTADAALPLQRAAARSGLVGLAHGLAGSAPLALLATAAMPTPATALVYLACFGTGTITGMVAFTLVLGAPFALIGPQSRRLVTAGTGLISLLFGSYLIWKIGIARSLTIT